MSVLRDALERFGVLILDGGTATELERRGADLSGGLWSTRTLLEAPEMVERLHEDWFRAGADIIETTTYQATIRGLSARGFSDDAARDVFRSAYMAADRARTRFLTAQPPGIFRPRPMIAASLGPYGAFLTGGREFDGRYDVTSAELSAHHRQQTEAVLQLPFDVLAFETFPRIDEARICAELTEGKGRDVWISFTSPNGRTTGSGEPLESAGRALRGFDHIVAVGVNCTPPQFVEEALERLRSATDLPLVAYPNSGESYADERWCGKSMANDFESLFRAYIAAGARMIGGCCRTSPQDIRKIADLFARRP